MTTLKNEPQAMAYIVADPGHAGGIRALGVVRPAEDRWIGIPYGPGYPVGQLFERAEDAENYVRGQS